MEDKERLVKVEESTKSAHKRLDKLEILIEDNNKIVSSVQVIASEMKAMREDVNKIDNRVYSIEKEPGQNYKDMKNKIVGQVVTFIIGAILSATAFYIFK